MKPGRCEAGQATVEWVGVVLLASLVFGGALAAVPVVDGRSLAGFLARHIVCAVGGDCDDAGLERAYGSADAVLVREYAPGLVYEPGERQVPVDYRRCRRVGCATAPDARALDVHRTDGGLRATAFTRVLRRGGRTYLQYWLYYPDSNSTVGEVHKLWNAAPLGDWPGWHADDWEGYQVRIDPDGAARARSSSHGHYQWCKEAECRNVWGRHMGWTRVSRGSHAGHQPLDRQELRERTTTGEGLRLVPLESIDRDSYQPLDEGIRPPWQKEVYADPESEES